MDHIKLNSYLRSIAFILFIVGAGIFSVTTLIDYRYKVEFLKQPCELCRELNPQLENCFKASSQKWIDPATGKEVDNKIVNVSQLYIPSNSFLTGTPNINLSNTTTRK